MFRNTGNQLHILCNRLHKFENVLSQVVTLEIWNPTFKNIGNRLLLCKTVIKLFGLLVIDYCLLVTDYQSVKTLVKDFSLKKFFWTNFQFFFFWKNLFILILMLFLKFLHILSLLLNLDSSLESWFLIERLFDS